MLLFSIALAPHAALAQAPVADSSKAAARQLTLDGYGALAQHDYAGAADRFVRADALFHAPTVLLGLARARVGLGKLVSAQELYNRLIRETLAPDASAAFVKAVEDGRTELAALVPRIPALTVQVRGADAPTITLDGVAMPAALLGVKQPVDPGQHVIRASARRSAPGETTTTLAEGRSETVTLDLAPLPPGAPDSEDPGSPGAQRSTGAVLIAGVAVTAAGVVAGAIFAGLWASKGSSEHSLAGTVPGSAPCPTNHASATGTCASLLSDLDSRATFGSVAIGSFAAAGAIGVATLVYGLTGSRGARSGVVFVPVLTAQGGSLLLEGAL